MLDDQSKVEPVTVTVTVSRPSLEVCIVVPLPGLFTSSTNEPGEKSVQCTFVSGNGVGSTSVARALSPAPPASQMKEAMPATTATAPVRRSQPVPVPSLMMLILHSP